MADSVEQKIITAIISRLTAIDGTGSFLTALATGPDGHKNVADSRSGWDAAEMPAISVFQDVTISEEDDDEGVSVTRKMSVLIKGFLNRATSDNTAGSDARKFIADIYRAIRSDDTWIVSSHPQASFSSESNHRIDYNEETFEITGVAVEIVIEYSGSKFNLEA